MAMAARRANQVLATVGLFAALAAARMAVELFPAGQAADALAELVVPPAAHAPEAPIPEEAVTMTAVVPEPVGVEPAPRRAPSRTGHEAGRPGIRLIRTPTLPS